MAMRDSVTVSISEEMIGMWSRRESERVVAVSAARGRISE